MWSQIFFVMIIYQSIWHKRFVSFAGLLDYTLVHIQMWRETTDLPQTETSGIWHLNFFKKNLLQYEPISMQKIKNKGTNMSLQDWLVHEWRNENSHTYFWVCVHMWEAKLSPQNFHWRLKFQLEEKKCTRPFSCWSAMMLVMRNAFFIYYLEKNENLPKVSYLKIIGIYLFSFLRPCATVALLFMYEWETERIYYYLGWMTEFCA